MAEKNVSAIKVFSRKSMCCFFTMTTFLFIMSCSFVLRSTRSESIGRVSKLLPTLNNSDSEVGKTQNSESSFGYRAILGDSEPKKAGPPTPQKQFQTVSCSNTITKRDKVVLNKVLKVFMYDLPPEFHFGLLDWKPEGKSVWPDMKKTKIAPHYPSYLNLQHNIEYWLTNLFVLGIGGGVGFKSEEGEEEEEDLW